YCADACWNRVQLVAADECAIGFVHAGSEGSPGKGAAGGVVHRPGARFGHLRIRLSGMVPAPQPALLSPRKARCCVRVYLDPPLTRMDGEKAMGEGIIHALEANNWRNSFFLHPFFVRWIRVSGG